MVEEFCLIPGAGHRIMMVFRDLGYIVAFAGTIRKDFILASKLSAHHALGVCFCHFPGNCRWNGSRFYSSWLRKKLEQVRSTAIVLATSFLDVLFYVLIVAHSYCLCSQDFMRTFQALSPVLVTFPQSYQCSPISSCLLQHSVSAGHWLFLLASFCRPQWISAIIKVLFRLPSVEKMERRSKNVGRRTCCNLKGTE